MGRREWLTAVWPFSLAAWLASA